MADASTSTQGALPTFMAAADDKMLNEEQKGVVTSIRMLEAEMAATPMSGE